MHTIYTDRHKLHNTDVGQDVDFYELPARAEAILSAVQVAQLGPVIAPTDHGLAPILAVHNADYVSFLQNAYTESAAHFQKAGPVLPGTFATRHAMRKPRSLMGLKGYYAFGAGTPILAGTWEAAYWSAQCALTAADRVSEGKRAAYALCRPPGHHAGPDLYGGYCFLNNAAIAARHLQAPQVPGTLKVPGTSIAILDVDYHHGNGTQIAFYADPTVLFCSLHVHPDAGYPYYWGEADERGAGPGEGYNHNWPLPLGTDDAAYLAALDEALAAVRAFAPHYLVVSLGLDTVASDPEGGFKLTSAGLAEVGRRVAGLDLPTLIVQEGGYVSETLGENAAAFLRAFV